MVRRPQRKAGQLAEHRDAEQSSVLMTNALALDAAAQTLQTTHRALVISVNMDQDPD